MSSTFAIYTLGCKVNQEESRQIAAALSAAGWRELAFNEKADCYIVNTCTVTHLADRKSRAMLRRAVRANPAAYIVAAGCFSQVSPQEAAKIEGIDLIIGVEERQLLPQLLAEKAQGVMVGDIARAAEFKSIYGVHRGTDRARAFLKIEDGCNEACAYCKIPQARGPVRSWPIAEVLQAARELIAAGHAEIVLTGIHLGAYGEDLPRVEDLEHLLPQLLALPALGRLRLGSLEPQHLQGDLLSLLKELLHNEKFCPHLHIPLQSGCDKTLRAMGRHYLTADYRNLAAALRAVCPDLALTTDIMVGFPGESEEDFAASAAFFNEMKFASAHIFAYSKRAGTAAAAMSGQLTPQVKEVRYQLLQNIAHKNAAAYAQSFLGKTLQMAVEQELKIGGKKYLSGHAQNYLPLLLPPPQAKEDRGLLTVVTEKILNEQIVCKSAGDS